MRYISGLPSLPFAAALFLTPSFAYASCAVPNIVRAGAVADASTGDILSTNGNIDARFNPASITKVVSNLVTLEAIQNGQMSLTQNIITAPAQDGYSDTGLRAGQNIILENALRASSASQNGIYIAIARTYPGGQTAFIQRMNEIARIAGAENTNFINPNGLFRLNISQRCDQQYTTIRDQFRILHYAHRTYPNEMRQYFGQPQITYNNNDPNITSLPILYPTSSLLADRDNITVREGIHIDFVKTGFIGYSGAHIFASATINNHRFYGIEIGMVRGASSENRSYRIRDMALLNSFRAVRDDFSRSTFMASYQQPTPTRVYFSNMSLNANQPAQPIQPQAASRPRDNFLPVSLRPAPMPPITQQITDSSPVTLSM